jgi:glycosyltransferase involved in cell wall biosynthesis
MQLPTTYETFAANDLRALRRLGVEISVHSLRPAHSAAERLRAEYGLSDVLLTHNSLAASLAGIGIALRQPAAFLSLAGWVVASTWRNPGHLLRSLILLPRVLHIVEAICRERPDVVHLFWGHYPALIGQLIRKRLPGTVLSLFLGAYDLTWNYGGTAAVARAADLVWTHARENVPAIAKLGVDEDRIAVSYRGVDLRYFGQSNRPKVPRRIVSASRLSRTKAVDDVLKIFARVLREWPDASLILLGNGPERTHLESLAVTLGVAHAVDFRGRVTQETVRAEMAAAEIFLLTSRGEAERLPNVVKEAMASRCLCVVTESPAIDELIQDGVHGYVVPQGDVEAAAQRISRVFAGEMDVAGILDEAAQHLRANFDVERSMQLYLDRWSQLVQGIEPRPAMVEAI